MSKELREALYRARATMAEGAQKCSEWGGSSNTSHMVEGFRSIDRTMQSGVEDADRVLLQYEQTSIFKLWVCSVCGATALPEPDPESEGDLHRPQCSHGSFDLSKLTDMELVTVERIT